MQRKAQNSHLSMWWPRSVLLNHGFWEQVPSPCAPDSSFWQSVPFLLLLEVSFLWKKSRLTFRVHMGSFSSSLFTSSSLPLVIVLSSLFCFFVTILISVSVFLCLCVRVCVYVCVNECIHVCVCVCVCVCVWMSAYMCMCVCFSFFFCVLFHVHVWWGFWFGHWCV